MIQEEKLFSVLSKQQRKWERLTAYMKRVPTEPMLVVTEIFYGGDLFLAERLKQEGVLLEAQSYWMTYLLPALTEYFGTEEITIGYDESIELAPLQFYRNERLIAICSPYWRTFQEVGIPGETELLEEKRQLLLSIEEKEKELERWQMAEENPILLGEDDTWLFAKATFNPKKYKKLARDKGIEVQQEVFGLMQLITSLEIKLEKARGEYLETSYYLDRIRTRVEKWGDFKFFAPETEGE